MSCLGGIGLIVTTVALGLALLLRLPAQDAEPWLDEILSLEAAHEAGTPWGVWTLKHDNNHRLVSLWLLSCPADAPPHRLRMLSLLAGLAAVLLAAASWHWLAGLLVAASWWPVLLSTEARGYSLAIAFALGAFLAIRFYWEMRAAAALAAFWGCSILAFVSHLSFLHVYLGFVAWSLPRTRGEDQLGRLLLIHGVPAAFLLFFWSTALHGMHL
ncbi:MAG: hypothetical protein K2W96_07430, partial [Gemmataceae bacterium]|nr:hypothetical protein [Gemmataceae bacterium]